MRRRLLIMIVIAAVLVIGAIAVVFFVDRNPALQNSVLQIANINVNTNSGVNTNQPPANTNTAADQDLVKREYAARNFTESFGSGTSQDNFANWEKTKPFVTDTFGAFLDRSLAQQRQANLTGAYRAYITKALVVTTTKSTATTASMTIGTQRQETIDTVTTTYYQDLLLDLVKVGDDWKVNAAAWNPLQ